MKKQILSLGLALLLFSQTAILPFSVWAESAEPSDSTVSEETTDPPESEESEETEGSAEPEAPVEEDYTHEISEAGLELIKSFEGFYRYAYWDYKQYSIGYGSYVASPDVYPDGITEREASDLLKAMIDDFSIMLNDFLVKYKIRLNQNQFDALMSFSYNLGKYVWVNENHSLRNLILSQNYTPEELTETFGLYCHAGGNRLEGLYQRRMREAAIFLSDYSMSDPDADLYVVNVSNTLAIRASASSSSTRLGTVKGSKVIRIHEYSEDGKWGFTSYCGYFGWVSMDYLVGIDEEEMVTTVDASGYDASGIHYTFDEMTMTASVGGEGSSNSSGYSGEYDGDVYLTKYLLYNGGIYILNSISDTAFTGCATIKTIYIPPAVTSVGENAFSGSSLKEIYYTDGSYAKTYAKESPFTATDERCISGHTADKWTVTVKASSTAAQTEEQTCTVCKEKLVRQHIGIEITSYPSKTEYKEGMAFQQSGLALRAVYSDGSTASISGFTVSGYDKTKLGTQTITVKYSVFTTTFTVKVSQKSLTKITVSKKPSKLSYIEGQALNTSGLAIKASYDNNTTAAVTGYKVSGYDPNKIGTQTITVTYNGKTATFQVTVRAKQLTAIQIIDYPRTVEYFCGEAFDPTGLRLKLSYDNNTTQIISEGFTVSGYEKDLPGTQTVRISYGGKVQTLPVTVILNYLKSDDLQVGDDNITGIRAGTTVSALRKLFDSGDRIEVLRNGKAIADTELVTTGLTVRLLYNGDVQDTAMLIVAGDLTGDGNSTIGDFMMLSDYLMDETTLTAPAMAAGDLDGDGVITLADYCALYSLTLLDTPSESV